MQQELELPHTQNGDVDWKTLGNILSACILGEVLCASYVDHKYGKKAKGFQADTDWVISYEEKDVIVLCKRFRDSPLNVFMGRTVIDAPVNEVARYMENHEKRKEWDKYLVEIKEVKKLSPTDCILYMLLEAKQCLVKQQREFVFYERMTYIGNKYVRSAISVDLPEIPLKHKIPRAELRPGTGFVLEPYDSSKTLISFIAHVDLKNLPPLIVNRAMRRQPMSVYRIRRIINSGQAQLPMTIQDDPVSVNTFTASDQYAIGVYSGIAQPMEGQFNHTSSMNHRYFEDPIPVGDFLSNSRPDGVHRSQSIPAAMSKTNGKVTHGLHFGNGNRHLVTLEDEKEELDRERSDSSPLFSDDYKKTPVQENGLMKDTYNDASVSGIEVHSTTTKGDHGEIPVSKPSREVGETMDDNCFDKTPKQNDFLLHLEPTDQSDTLDESSSHDSEEFVDAQDDISLTNGLTTVHGTDDEVISDQLQAQQQDELVHQSSNLQANDIIRDDGLTLATELVELDVSTSHVHTLNDSTHSTVAYPQRDTKAQELQNGTGLRQSISPFSSDDDDERCSSLPTITLASTAVKAASSDDKRPQKVQSADDILANSSNRYNNEESLTSPINGNCNTTANMKEVGSK